MHDQRFDYVKKNVLAVYYTEISVNLTPFEWGEMFRNAEFVFTETFHGAVFSILNIRQFTVNLTNASRIKKVGALLKELGIENREIKKPIYVILKIRKMR